MSNIPFNHIKNGPPRPPGAALALVFRADNTNNSWNLYVVDVTVAEPKGQVLMWGPKDSERYMHNSREFYYELLLDQCPDDIALLNHSHTYPVQF